MKMATAMAVACLSVGGLAIGQDAQAIVRHYDLNIPKQSLDMALRDLAQQTGLQIALFSDTIDGSAVVGPVLGTQSAEEALQRLLVPRGLSYKRVSEGTIAVLNPNDSTLPARVPSQEVRKKSFWERFRISQTTDPSRSSISPPSGSRQKLRLAQASSDQAAVPTEITEITVTGTRIDRAGYDAPTPTLRISAQDLSVGERPNVAAALNDLPQFRATQSAQTTTGNIGAGNAPVDLRGLGISRTLVLLDGRRFVGDNDLNSIPTVLIRNVDVVTGGASAAWGSGAVAGVVNITLDDSLDGIRLGASGGTSSSSDADERRFEAAFGKGFADGRGHVLLGAEYLDNDGVLPRTSRANVGRWAVVPDGAGRFVIAPDVGFSNAAYGGLILSGVLSGHRFDPDGSLHRFDAGTVRGTSSIGGEGPSNDDIQSLVTPQRRYNALARGSYQLSDQLTATAEVRHWRMYNDYIWNADHDRGSLTIRSDNAFLPDAVRSAMTAAGQTSFTFGRFNNDFSFGSIDYEREATQGILALDGTIGGQLRWSAYYSHGVLDNNIDTPRFIIRQNYANAVDSVISPTTGSPICRIALTDPTTNCVPINLFGEGAPSAAAKDYATGTPQQRSTTTLDVGGVSLRGEPVSLPAGEVSFAVGLEARREEIDQTVSALDAANAFRIFNFQPIKGSFDVKEAFGEVVVPLVHETPLLQQLELNAAVRVSDYSTTGSIWSWKVGVSNEFFTGFRGRATHSRDIRSANLTELYTQSAQGTATLIDPVTRQTVFIPSIGGGNPNLLPEVSNTFTGGLTWSPAFADGLDVSVDYYDIEIDDAIVTIGAQDLVNRCFNGNSSLCAQIDRDVNGNLIRVRPQFVNLTQYLTEGVDAEVSYVMPFSRLVSRGDGQLRFRLLGTWVNSLETDDGVSVIRYVQSQGQSTALGVPKWRVSGSIGYENSRYSADVRARYISSGEYNINQDITNGQIGSYTYVDLRFGTRIPMKSGASLELYGSVTNVFDKDPPIGSVFSAFYDVIGRYMSVGARVRM